MRVEAVVFLRYQNGGRESELLPGQTYDVPDALARMWIAAGKVRAVESPKKKGGPATS